MKFMSEIEEASNWEIASTKKMISYSFGFVIFSYLNSVFALSVFYFYEVEIGLPIDLLGISFVIYAIWSMIKTTLLGIRLFFVRTSIIFQAIIITWVHFATGYNPDPHAVQTATAVWGIRVHTVLIPMICIFLSGFVMLFFYDLKGDKQKAIKSKLRERGL